MLGDKDVVAEGVEAYQRSWLDEVLEGQMARRRCEPDSKLWS